MAQSGFHGLIGLGVARLLGRRMPTLMTEAFTGGLCVGAMLPDIDMYPTAVAFLLGHKEAVYDIHRTATHSAAALAAVAIAAAFRRRRRPSVSVVLLGAAFGAATHISVDLFVWFAQLDVLWPLSRVPRGAPLAPIMNLWAGFDPPGIVRTLLEAMEYLGFALFLGALARILGDDKQRDAERRSIASVQRWCWVVLALAVAGAFAFAGHPSRQNVLVTTPYLLFFAPYVWTRAWRLRGPVSGWSRTQGREA